MVGFANPPENGCCCNFFSKRGNEGQLLKISHKSGDVVSSNAIPDGSSGRSSADLRQDRFDLRPGALAATATHPPIYSLLLLPDAIQGISKCCVIGRESTN